MLIIIYELIINAAAFLMYGVDKLKAERGKYRIPEARLIFVAFIGGAFGAWLGMRVFHHKTLKPKFRLVKVFLVLQVMLAVFCLYQNLHIVVTNYSCSSEKYDGHCRVVQVSDLHNQFFGFSQGYLLKKISECEPDIIAVTGDAIDAYHTNYYLARRFFKGAAEIAPTYYITGNHEIWLDKDEFDSFLSDIEGYGTKFADNKVFDTCGLHLVGLADDSLEDDTLKNIMPDDGFTLLLAHEPSYFANYATAGADLVLSGHLHGGQFVIPDKGGLISPDIELFPQYYEGMHKMGETEMVVSRGMGNSVIPIRLNNYPEIVVVDIN